MPSKLSQAKSRNNKYLILIVLFEISLFLFLRFYNINQSLFFINDMGRDLHVLQKWMQSGKPPLLGPQTSALPFNQSAIYFYLLYPAFLISQQSPLSALYTNTFIYLSTFIIGLYLLKNQKKMQKSLLIIFFLISIHPQYIIQSRYVWNPSFATPFIVASLFTFLLIKQKFNRKTLWIFSFSLAIALSLTYSIAPFFLSIVILALIKFKQKLTTIITLIVSLILTNLPTIAFEIRHNFLLSLSLFTKNSPIQKDITMLGKITNLSQYLLATPYPKTILLIVLLLTLYIATKSKKQPLKLFSLIFLVSFTLNLITPITIQAHYIFAYTSLFFILVSYLPPKLSLATILILSLIYLQPKKINSYFKPATRTYQQMLSCFSQVCQQQIQPIFVTVQSSYHPYHYGPEHRYLLAKSGCQIVNIEDNPGTTDTMALVVDGGNYEHQKTNFYELDLFGQSQIDQIYDCQANFKVYILKKNVK